MSLINQDDTFQEMFLDKDVDIPIGRYAYPCRLKLNSRARFLSVQFMADFANRSTAILPVFARWNYGKILGSHVLSICDPTIYLDQNLSLGWYLGNEVESVLPGIVAIAQRCSEKLGVGTENIVYMGSSGGGFAALQAAAFSSNGKAIAINAQTNLLNFNRNILQNYVDLATKFESIDAASQYFGLRWDAINALRRSIFDGRSPKVVMVNNTNGWHYKAHYLPLANEFGLSQGENEEATCTSNFKSILYDGPHAHTPETPEILKRITAEGIPFLLSELH